MLSDIVPHLAHTYTLRKTLTPNPGFDLENLFIFEEPFFAI